MKDFSDSNLLLCIEALIERLDSRSRNKRCEAAQDLASLLQIYFERLNSGKMPAIRSFWNCVDRLAKEGLKRTHQDPSSVALCFCFIAGIAKLKGTSKKLSKRCLPTLIALLTDDDALSYAALAIGDLGRHGRPAIDGLSKAYVTATTFDARSNIEGALEDIGT